MDKPFYEEGSCDNSYVLLSGQLYGENKVNRAAWADSENFLKDAFLQALVNIKVQDYTLDLRNDKSIEEYHEKKLQKHYINYEVKKLMGRMNVGQYLYNKVREMYEEEMDKNTKIVFFIDVYGRKSDTPNNVYHPGFANKQNGYDVIFKYMDGINKSTLSHELLHLHGLNHTFSNRTSNTPNARFTYRGKATQNIMDYSTENFLLWYWQWTIVNRNA